MEQENDADYRQQTAYRSIGDLLEYALYAQKKIWHHKNAEKSRKDPHKQSFSVFYEHIDHIDRKHNIEYLKEVKARIILMLFIYVEAYL